ncbi:hypothetical protein [Fluviicola sp.]|uniref:hypothetical protein n=1 Tax=Fluviicola sp. TaxID=1917219 RepID=UPI0031CDDD46
MNRFFFIAIMLLFGSSVYSQSSSEEWDDYFMPGIGYKVYTPKNHSKLGVYQGIVTEFVIYASAKNQVSRMSGPARVKTYANLSILKSDQDSARNIFNVNFGLNLSFEGKCNRKYLIPYFGLEVGGLFQRNYSSMQFTPVAGVQLFSNKRMIWNVQAGYNYTVKYFEDYSGMQYSTTFNLLLWNN